MTSTSLRWGTLRNSTLSPVSRAAAAVLSGTPRGAELVTSKGQRASAADAEKLMQKLLGWSAPVTSLRYWVLGIPDPARPQSRLDLDGQGRIAQLDQSGWQLDYEEYHKETESGLPQLILAKGSTLDIKLLIKEWELVGPDAQH